MAFLPSSDSRKARETFAVSEAVLGALRSPVGSQLYSGMNHHNRPKQSSQSLDFEGIRFLLKDLRFQKEVVFLQKKLKRFYGFVLRGELRLPTAFFIAI